MSIKNNTENIQTPVSPQGAALRSDLIRIFGEENVLENEMMSRHVTFRTGGPADFFVSADEASLAELVKLSKEAHIPCLVIGRGSNLLVGDKGIRGVVAQIGSRMSDIRIEDNVIRAGAGTSLSSLASAAAGASLTGLEFAAGIPGSLGGAVCMNAGAYGGEMKDVLIYADVITEEGRTLRLSADELELSYRHSIIPEKGYLVTAAAVKLKNGDMSAIRERMNGLMEKRVLKQPLEYPSAGSTFKRPEGYFAGKLIEDSGLRGFAIGGAQVSEKHCGFVINKGDAASSDILELIRYIQKKVFDEQGVMLEPEVKFAGEF